MEKKKMNDKGFSLVELIIVIAIMAVLVGILAPQYLKYVETSRQSSDISNVDEMISAVEIYSADPSNSIVTGDLSCSSGTVTADTTVVTALSSAGINTLPTMKSSAYQNWTISFSSTGVSFSSTDDGAALQTALGR